MGQACPDLERSRDYLHREEIMNAIMSRLRVLIWAPVALPSAVLAAVARRPKREGACPVCDYEYTGAPERCPGCRTIPVARKRAIDIATMAFDD